MTADQITTIATNFFGTLGLGTFFYLVIRSLKGQVSSLNNIVEKLKSGIESQSTIVDTAMKYADKFDPDKMETIIRKEMEHDKKVEIDKINQKFERFTKSAIEVQKQIGDDAAA